MKEIEFDQVVGRIAGAIYSDISEKFPLPPLVLVPALTFKVRKALEPVTDLRLFSNSQRRILANDIHLSIIPVLFSLEVDPGVIERISPVIEPAVLKAMQCISR